jgi:hypothetical protein
MRRQDLSVCDSIGICHTIFFPFCFRRTLVSRQTKVERRKRVSQKERTNARRSLLPLRTLPSIFQLISHSCASLCAVPRGRETVLPRAKTRLSRSLFLSNFLTYTEKHGNAHDRHDASSAQYTATIESELFPFSILSHSRSLARLPYHARCGTNE